MEEVGFLFLEGINVGCWFFVVFRGGGVSLWVEVENSGETR